MCGVCGGYSMGDIVSSSLTHFLNAAALFEVGDPDAGAARSASSLRFGLPRLLVHHRLHFPHLLRDGVAGCIGIQANEPSPAQVLFNVRSRTDGFVACEKQSESEEGAGRGAGLGFRMDFRRNEWKERADILEYGEGGGRRRRASGAKQYVRVNTIWEGQALFTRPTHVVGRHTRGEENLGEGG